MTIPPDPPETSPAVGAGREAAAAAVTAWLSDPSRPRLCLVTGAPATGKSSLVARVALTSLRAGRAHAIFSARGMTLHAATWAVAEQLALPGGGPDSLVERVAADTRPITLIVGELDECGVRMDGADAGEIIGRLLSPLLELPHVRVLVEGRPQAVAPLRRHPAETFDLDEPSLTDRQGFTAWLRRVAARQGVHDPAVVEAAATLYPNAGLAELALRASPGEDVPLRWLRSVPQQAWPALEALAGAYAPISPQVWWAWTAALAGDAARGQEALSLARPLVARVGDRYTLDCRILRERIRGMRDAATAAQVAVLLGHALFTTLPAAGGAVDWANADPYAAAQILRHAVATGVAERLLEDLGCVVHADPVAVTATLEELGDRAPAELVRAWEFAGPALLETREPAERAAMLHLAARCTGGTGTAGRLAGHAAAAPWTTRWADARPGDSGAGRWAGPVEALAFAPAGDGGRLLAAGAGTLRLLSPVDGRPVGRSPQRIPDARAVLAFTDGSVLCLDGGGGLVNVRGVREPSGAEPLAERVRATVAGHRTAPLSALAADESGRGHIMAGDRSGAVHLWRPGDDDPGPVSWPLHVGPVTAVTCLRTRSGGHLAVSGGADGAVRLWSPGEEGVDGDALLQRDCPVTAVAGASRADGALIAAGWADGFLWLWHSSADRELVVRLGFPVNALVLTGDGVLFVGGPHGVCALDARLDRASRPAA
ncbi:hypothetical protein [Thermomonospora catenispora]|uniref:hypothetical protein n=1 Tax=Thermomonospora catenispora TaxID=2493090 RepID=UPI0013756D5A|nr:hypothetical protein [Thermomonospora catenispora]